MKLNNITIFLLLKGVLFSGLVFLLGGCVAPQVNFSPTVGGAVAPENTGVVLVRVINGGNVALPLNYITFAPDNMNESEEIKAERLTRLDETLANDAIFAAYVPAGNYSVSSLRSYHVMGEFWYSRWVSTDVSLGTFTISPGQVTDLGTLVYYPKVMEDRYIDTVVRVPDSELRPFYTKLKPHTVLPADGLNGWTEDDLEGDRHTQFASMVQNPVVFSSQYVSEDNTLYMAAKLGVLLSRNQAGEWHLEAIDTESEINAMASNQSGDLVVAGDYGTVFIKNAEGTWRDVSIGHDGSVQDVLFYGEHEVDLVVRRNLELVILRGNITEQSVEWKKMTSYVTRTGWYNSAGNLYLYGKYAQHQSIRRIARAYTQKVDGVNYIFVASQKGLGGGNYITRSQTETFEFDQATWRVKDSKGFRSSVDVVLPAGETYLGIDKPGTFSFRLEDKYLRYDEEEKRWVKMATKTDNCPGAHISVQTCTVGEVDNVRRYQEFDYVSVPVFLDSKHAVVFASYLPRAEKERKVELFETWDGGVSWAKTGRKAPSEYCAKMIPEVKDVLLVSCAGISSDMYESHDLGETWQHVREHESF